MRSCYHFDIMCAESVNSPARPCSNWQNVFRPNVLGQNRHLLQLDSGHFTVASQHLSHWIEESKPIESYAYKDNTSHSPKVCDCESPAMIYEKVWLYIFRILDDFGWNFRSAKYHEENRRTLYKMYGLKVRKDSNGRFVIFAARQRQIIHYCWSLYITPPYKL
jgi:hypothetical protein